MDVNVDVVNRVGAVKVLRGEEKKTVVARVGVAVPGYAAPDVSDRCCCYRSLPLMAMM